MKYVMLDGHIPILFPSKLCHVSFSDIEGHKVTSAGNVTFMGEETKVFGGSTSIKPNVHSDPKDKQIIEFLITEMYDPIMPFYLEDPEDALKYLDEVNSSKQPE